MSDKAVVDISMADMASVTWLSQTLLGVTFNHILMFASLIFVLGLCGAWFGGRVHQKVNDRSNEVKTAEWFNVYRVLLKPAFAIQLMLLAIMLIFLAAGRYWQTADGQLVVIVVLVFAVTQMLLACMLAFVLSEQSSELTASKSHSTSGEDA